MPPQNNDEQLSPYLEHILENGDDNAKHTHSLLENNLELNHSHAEQVIPLMENQLEKQGETVDALKTLSDKLIPKEVGEIGDGSTITVKGLKGDKGEKGDKGDMGDIGPVGAQGESVTGPQGLQGEKGEQGPEGKPGKNGKNGIDGLDAEVDYERIISDALSRLPKPQATKNKAITADEILSKIKGALSYNDLKDIPTAFKGMAGTGYLREISDVDVSGLTVGQALKWDGKRWIPFTPSGGGSSTTSVYSELVSGNNTTFTLADTPISGTERVYAGRNRLYPVTDYSISGKIITTVLTWSTGDIVADYEK